MNTKNYTKEHKYAKMCTHESDVIQYDILDPVYVGSDANVKGNRVPIPQVSLTTEQIDWLTSHQDFLW